MLQIYFWPNVILHLDGDAFFSSVFQAVNPNLKGKPVVTGSERGLATAVSYEARKYGVKRGMLTWQIKKICPQCVILESDYELYSLFSHKMFGILRTFTPTVEEYSVDEAFADIKGLRRPLSMSYLEIAQAIKNKVESSLGISISVGVSITKSLAKLASSHQKPSGLTVIDGRNIEELLAQTKIQDVWGIGPNTTAYLEKFNVKTALDFVLKSENFIQSNLSKPFYEIWKELRGEKIYELDTRGKQSYKGITRSQTFTPSTNSKDLLWARLSIHIEEAFTQARKFHYLVGKISPFLKTQNFEYHTSEIKLKEKVAYPYLIRKKLREAFDLIYKKGVVYRSTGCTISGFQEDNLSQMTLFDKDQKLEEKIKKIYPLFEKKKIDFGSMLFDKQRSEKIKHKPRLNLPILELMQ
ncbi:hypothetical protein A2774_03450 [Candidatus Roizmanbacteria bacterium RIFCSPHIGHO2_01_FULL_39_12c]|uniref:UmuC domain-containing protein n=1 Tax=Candidatus Roizmanbacteria bacterium RIFCSPHIGHO2_01_FULL_39_12c TaxID=1802031 RepID=A0A1F7G8Y7_9BACT|nr:MAG: hypothetical protein A2774_03450 [Candidatus Roizmanbacteria bacterium RIFCSPHIGHO2_01_FULL_39_12c]OGK47843.1 MAG: hypothetical protein A2963_03245 [Candidatus Roizmanbacteria bacterium RIFCSPLOWO2_01_FULL_40_13]